MLDDFGDSIFSHENEEGNPDFDEEARKLFKKLGLVDPTADNKE